MPGRSQNSARYGSLAEQQMADRYDLDLDREHWRDAIGPDGRPWEIKATMRERASGETGRFRLFKQQHDKLLDAGGFYAFVVYRPHGRGIRVLDQRAVRASEISVDWGPSEHMSPNRDRQTKLPIREVFR